MPDAPPQPISTRLIAYCAVGLTIVLVGFLYLMRTPSDTFVILPDQAHAASGVVLVGGHAPSNVHAGHSGIYYLDIFEHRASIGESWLVHFEPGNELIPANEELPGGSSEADQARVDRLDIDFSKQIAQVVALTALHRHFTTTKDGVIVVEIDHGTHAYLAGLRVGMVVVGLDGTPVTTFAGLRKLVTAHRPGDTVHVQVIDGSVHRTITTKLIASVKKSQAPLIGFQAIESAVVHPSVPISFDTGQLGGPSAGLAFTLEIYDALTGGHLAKGYRIAVTGTIDRTGTVGEIGGMREKAIGAYESGADLLLVPPANLAEARANAHGIRVIPVSTFKQALKVIRLLPVKK